MARIISSFKYALIFGFFIWLIPFIVSVLIFPFKATDQTLFETIMPVTLTFCVAIFFILYLMGVKKGYLKEGIIVGFIWLIMSIAIDLLMFIEGPMKMPPDRYMIDIGLTYLIYPIVTTSMGYILEKYKGP
jgi:hypothetical protein